MQQNKRQRYLLAPGATVRQKDSIRLYKVLTSERFGLPRMSVRAAALEPKVCVRTPIWHCSGSGVQGSAAWQLTVHGALLLRESVQSRTDLVERLLLGRNLLRQIGIVASLLWREARWRIGGSLLSGSVASRFRDFGIEP